MPRHYQTVARKKNAKWAPTLSKGLGHQINEIDLENVDES